MAVEYIIATTTVGGMVVRGTALVVDGRPVAIFDERGQTLAPDPGTPIEVRLYPVDQ